MTDVFGPQPLGEGIQLPLLLRPADATLRREIDALAAAATTVALAAMGRDARVQTVVVRVDATLWQMTEVRQITCDMDPPDLRDAVAQRVEDAARAMGWRVIGPGDGGTWDWVLIFVQRSDHTAHEIAHAMRKVAL